jgi:hypothetical protein
MLRRGLLFIFLWAAVGLAAQPVRLQAVELDYRHQKDNDTLRLQALLSFSQGAPQATVRLLLQDAQIEKISWVQGLPKGSLPFQYVNQTLRFKLPRQYESRTQVQVSYFFLKSRLAQQPFFKELPQGFAVNALNLVEEESFGQAGFFYPAQAQQKTELLLNLLLPEKIGYKAPGLLEFTASSPGYQAYFLRSPHRLKAEDFYLILGNFKKDAKAEDLDQDFAFSEESLQALRAQEVANQIGPALDFYSAATGFLFLEQEQAALHKPTEVDSSLFFLQIQDLAPQGISPLQLNRNRAAALMATRNKPQAANALQFEYYRQKLGAAWQTALLQARLAKDFQQNDFFWQVYLNQMLAQEGLTLTLADTARLRDTLQPLPEKDTRFLTWAKQLYRTRRPLQAQVNFKYTAGNQQLRLIFTQRDSTLHYPFPVALAINLGPEKPLRYDTVWVELGQADTLKLPLEQSPRSVRLTPLYPSLTNLQQNRPQNYWLAELSQKDNPQWQQEALEHLLANARGNLFSTVVGIALRGNNPALQLKALAKAGDLKPAGQQKLKSTLERLAQSSPHAAVQAKARQRVEQFYGQKP